MQLIKENYITLITAMGSHTQAVNYYIEDRRVNKMYIFTMTHNTPKFELKTIELQRNIKKKQKNLSHNIYIEYINIDENNLFEMYDIFLSVYLKNTSQYIITDITASHKRVSYILMYAHNFASIHFKKLSKIVYFFENPLIIKEMPLYDITRFSKNQEEFLIISYKIEFKILSIEKLKKFPRSSISRYRLYFQKKGYMNKDRKLTLKGLMFVKTLLHGVKCDK